MTTLQNVKLIFLLTLPTSCVAIFINDLKLRGSEKINLHKRMQRRPPLPVDVLTRNTIARVSALRVNKPRTMGRHNNAQTDLSKSDPNYEAALHKSAAYLTQAPMMKLNRFGSYKASKGSKSFAITKKKRSSSYKPNTFKNVQVDIHIAVHLV